MLQVGTFTKLPCTYDNKTKQICSKGKDNKRNRLHFISHVLYAPGNGGQCGGGRLPAARGGGEVLSRFQAVRGGRERLGRFPALCGIREAGAVSGRGGICEEPGRKFGRRPGRFRVGRAYARSRSGFGPAGRPLWRNGIIALILPSVTGFRSSVG